MRELAGGDDHGTQDQIRKGAWEYTAPKPKAASLDVERGDVSLARRVPFSVLPP
jgi:hypothetical protein